MKDSDAIAAASHESHRSNVMKKNLAATYKKYSKNFKLRDVEKKIEAIRFCVQDENFLKEEEVLTNLIGFLSRYKIPQLVLETLITFDILLDPSTTFNGSEIIHPGQNAHFILEASIAADSIWKAGEPFLSILSASITDEVKIKAVQVFGRLLYHCYHPITEADAANTAKQLEQLQTVGDPLKNLVACLSSESIELKLGAISTLELLFIKPPSEEYYTQLETTLGGFVKLFDFTTRSEIRFNVPILQLTESFSRCSSGRDILVCHGALDVMKNLVKNAVQALNIPSPNPEETPLVLECISLLSLIIVRLVFTCDQIESLPLLEESHMIPIIDDLLIILQVLDGSNAGLVAGHESLVASVMTQVISSLGRMIERSSVVKARAKEKGLLSLLLPRLKATEPLALRVVSEKLLHICCLTQDSEARQEIIDPQILSSTEEKPSFLTLDSVLGLFTTEISTITSSPLENLSISRFVAKIVGSHENAKVLGEKPQAMEIFLTSLLQIQPTDEAEDARASQKLVGYLSKTIQAIAHISAEACDQCGKEEKNPINALIGFLKSFDTASPPALATEKPGEEQAAVASQKTDGEYAHYQPLGVEQVFLQLPTTFSWSLNKEEEEKEAKHYSIVNFNEEETDYYLSAASAVMELANSLLQHNENTSSLPDMSVDSDPNGAIAATTTGTTTTTKQDPKNTKKLSISPALPITGSITKFHSIVLCKDISRSVLDKGLEILDLVKKFSSKKSQVAVKLLQTVQVLLRLPGGRKNLLSQASTSTTEATTALFDWPFVKISAEDEQQPVLDKDYSRLVGPILDVINDASTDFNQIETAVQILKTLTTPSEAEDTLADAQSTIASVPAATATTPAAIAAAQAALTAAITSATNQLSKITDGIIRESDYFANVAVISGALISLIGLCDKARVKLLAKDIKLGSIDVLYEQILELVTYYLTLGTQRQQQAESKRQNLLEQITTTLPTANIDTSSLKTIEFQSKWTPLLDLQFDLTRFGYKNYSAMLLATELGLFQIVQQLLEAGASTETKNAEGTSALMLAFLQGHEQLVDLLLKYHADIDAINNHHLNVLGCALVGSQSINVHTWIDEAYDTDKSDSHEAYQRLSLLPSSLGELVLKCLNHSVDLNISDLEGNFLLHSLLSEKYVYIKIRGLDIGFHYQSEDTSQLGLLVETLLNPQYLMDVNVCNLNGQTALHLALLYGHKESVQHLLSNGANPNILDQHGFAGIHYACMGFCGLEGVEEILRASVKYEIIQGEHVDKGKYKSKQEKLAMAIDEILSNGFREIVNPRALSLRCATTNKILHLASKSQGLLSFHMACGGAILALEDGEPAIPFDTTRLKAYAVANAETRAEILSFLQKKHQVELTASTIQGFNGLHLAMKSDVNGSNHNVTQVLLKANVDVNAVHEYSAIDTSHRAPEAGDRVLYDQEEAIVCSRSFVTRRYHLFLTKRCVHVDNIALSGLKPAENIDYFRLVMESSLSPLHYALQRSDAASKSLLETGKTQLLQSDGCDVPLLALACAANRSIEIIGAMINEQANVRVALKINDIKSGTALHYAVSNGNTPVVQALVSHPEFVSVNVRRSGDGYTPLHIAVAEHARDVELLRVLLNGGGSLLETCDEYVTPLHLLIQQTQLETLKELVESGHLSPELLTREIPDINGNCSSILRFAEEINLKLYHLVAASNRSSISNQELSIPLVPVVEDDDQQKKDKSNQLMAFLLDVVSSIEGVVHVHESFSNGMILPEWNKKKSIIEKSTGRVLKVSSISSIPQE